jgi:hypothetical protein
VYARVSEAAWTRSFPAEGQSHSSLRFFVEARVAVFSIKQDGGSTGGGGVFCRLAGEENWQDRLL